LPGNLHHGHQAGVHAEDVDFLADDGAGAGENVLQFPVVQGIAAGSVVIADASVGGILSSRRYVTMEGGKSLKA